jgi:hypothetical protein
MANIKLSDVGVTKQQQAALSQNYLYKDLYLDLQTSYSYNAQFNRKQELRDVQALFDNNAISQSIANIFLTSPGQKILNPEFGLDLRQFIFEPVDTFIALEIQSLIEDKLPIFEPRITLENVSVLSDIDSQQYDVSLQINVPSLNIYGLSLKGVLNSSGYYIV